jgi:drug/metabolite transporter (DMT)-like permease
LRRVSENKNNPAIAGSLLLVVLLWGGNNAGTKWLVHLWPPVFTGATRFLFAGFILLAVLRFTKLLGDFQPLTAAQRRQLWLRGGLGLAAYTVVFCWALRLTAASHVALYIGASPVWALLVEQRPQKNWSSVRRYGAALLAVTGVLVLFWPALKNSSYNPAGECCGLASSLLWANYNHQSRILARTIHGVEVAANSMWMSGVWLLPVALIEISLHGLMLDTPHLGIQSLAILFGGVVPYAMWNSALRHWETSRVMLFNNLIPLSTTTWAHYALGEPITPTFCAAMVLIVAGVALGQMDWAKIFKEPESF